MLTRKLPCPSCGVGLKIAEDLAAGKKITCPKCGVGFPVPEGNGQSSAPMEAVVRVRKPAIEEGVEQGEDENEELAERPVVRKRRRPLPSEDDDEPVDEEEERPPPRRRRKFKKKKQPSRMPLILALVIGGILLLGAGVSLAVVFLPKENKSASVGQNSPAGRPSRMAGGGPRGGEGPAGGGDEKSGQESPESKPSESGSDASDPYAAGKQVFQRTCARCHRMSGSSGQGGPGGRRGPDLSTIGRDHDVDWLMDFIRDPKSRKPDSTMPKQRLSDEELRAVAIYLASLK